MRALSARQAELRRILPALEYWATTAEAAAEAAFCRQERLATEVSVLEVHRLAVRSLPAAPVSASARPILPTRDGMQPVEMCEMTDRTEAELDVGLHMGVARDLGFQATDLAAPDLQAGQSAAVLMSHLAAAAILPALPIAGSVMLGLPPKIGAGC